MANTEPQVLVTGATGTVGRELVLALRRLHGPVREARMQNLQTAYRDIRNHDRIRLPAGLGRPPSSTPVTLPTSPPWPSRNQTPTRGRRTP